METFSALLAICAGNSPVSGEFPAQRPVTRSFDVFFDLRLGGRLSKHSWGWWLETPSCPLWRQSNAPAMLWDFYVIYPNPSFKRYSDSFLKGTMGTSHHWPSLRLVNICPVPRVVRTMNMIYNALWLHYNDVIMSAVVSPITSLTIGYSIVYSGAYQRKHQSSASLAFVRGIHRRIPRTNGQ